MAIEENDYVLILAPDDKTFLLQVSVEKKLSTHLGMLSISDVIGKNYGDKIVSGLGNEFYLLQPTTWDKMMKINRQTQIIYPKDAAIILLKTGLAEGMRVIECGTGSGALTIALANTVKPGGKVFTYEKRDQFREIATKNVEIAGLSDYVEFKSGDARDGFDVSGIDVAVIDLPSPWDGVASAAKSLKGAGRIASISPTFNQVEENYKHLEQSGFIYLETVEVLVRNILVREGKTRPTQRMISHTGFLTFGRKINKDS
jgi:tRNA (adenine57-N1/adenine58-N1)-methyltransferase